MTRWKTYLILIVVMATWGLNVVATKQLVAEFSPITMTAFRIFTAGLFVLLFLRSIGQLPKLSKSHLKLIVTAGTFNVVAHHGLLALGLTQTSATNAGLILGLGPLLTSLLSIKLIGHRLSAFQWVGLLLGFSGVSLVVLSGANGIGISIGDPIIFLSILSQAISFILIRKGASTLDARALTGWMMVYGSAVLFVLGLIFEPHGLAQMWHGDGQIWAIFFASAIIASGMGHMIYNRSIQSIGPVETSIFLNFNPLFSLIGATIFLDEHITSFQLIGFGLIVLGVLLGARVLEMILNLRKKRTHKAIAH